MKLSKSAAGILSARYKSVLIKCLLANLMLFSLPAAAEDITIKDGDYIDKFFDGENITISGGTFTNSIFRAGKLIINGGKIEGTLSVGGYHNISIDSDAAVVNLTWDKNSATYPSLINAPSLDIKGKRGKEGFSSDSAGFAAGIEAYVSDDFKAGFGYSYAATSIDADRSDTDVYTHTGFAYAHYQPERFYTNFFAGVGHSSYEDTTKIAKLESDYQTNTISAQIAVGYAAPVLSPEAALRVINTHQKAYTDALGAELEAKSSVTATAVGGFRLSKRYRLRANTAASFVPELKAAVSYDFARSNQNRTAVLPNGASYVVETEKDKRFGVEAGAGFSFGFEKIGSLSLMYDGMFQGKLQSHSVLLNMKINL